MTINRRILTATSVALVAAAVTAGAASTATRQGDPGWREALIARSDAMNSHYGLADDALDTVARPDDRAGLLGVGAASALATKLTAIPDAFERAVARSTDAVARPDDRGDARGPGVYFTVPPVASAAIAADGFEWGDASAGAGAMLMAILLAAGVAVSLRHRGRTILP